MCYFKKKKRRKKHASRSYSRCVVPVARSLHSGSISQSAGRAMGMGGGLCR